MGVTITTRVSNEIARELTKISKLEHLNRSAVIRRLLISAINNWKVDFALKEYSEGKITLWKAAEIAKLSLREMIDLAAEKGIPIQYTVDDLKADFEAVI